MFVFRGWVYDTVSIEKRDGSLSSVSRRGLGPLYFYLFWITRSMTLVSVNLHKLSSAKICPQSQRSRKY